MKPECLSYARNSLEIEQKAIKNVAPCVETSSFAQTVDILSTVPKVITCASGSSGIAAKKFAHSLCCIEKSAMFMPPCEAVHGGLGALKQGNALVMVSRGGETAELLPIIDVCIKKEATLIAVTENTSSYLARHADIVLPLIIEKESDKYNMMATSSYIATIALFDALLAAVMEETDYKREQFALIHPGGAVGKMFSEEKQ